MLLLYELDLLSGFVIKCSGILVLSFSMPENEKKKKNVLVLEEW